MRGVPQCDRPPDRAREADLEGAPRSLSAVVVSLVATHAELIGSQSTRPDPVVDERLDLRAGEPAGLERVATLQLLPEHLPDEGGLPVGSVDPFPGVTLAAAALQMSSGHEGRRRSPDRRRAQEPRAGEVLVRAQADEDQRQLAVAGPQPT